MMAVILRPLILLSSICAISYGFPYKRTYGATHCKAFPGSASWPSQESWAALNESLGGRLIRPVPPGGVCHPGQPTYDADACAIAAEDWTSYEFHTSDPVSISK